MRLPKRRGKTDVEPRRSETDVEPLFNSEGIRVIQRGYCG